MHEPRTSPAWASTAVGELIDGARQAAFVLASSEVASYVSVPEPAGGPAVMALLSPLAVRLPIGVVLAGPLPAKDSRVFVGEGAIVTPEGTFRPTRWWDPHPHVDAAALLTGAPELLDIVEACPSGVFGLGLVEALSVARALAEGAAGPGLAVLGLGPGLTPAGDDVVSGALAVLSLTGRLQPAVARSIETHCPTRTTALSACLLAAAARGQVIPQVVDVLRALETGVPAVLERAAETLFGVGASSGYALCAGMAGALGGLALEAEVGGEPAMTLRSPL